MTHLRTGQTCHDWSVGAGVVLRTQVVDYASAAVAKSDNRSSFDTLNVAHGEQFFYSWIEIFRAERIEGPPHISSPASTAGSIRLAVKRHPTARRSGAIANSTDAYGIKSSVAQPWAALRTYNVTFADEIGKLRLMPTRKFPLA